MTGLLARARSLWRGLRRRSEVEAEMAAEFALHVELRAADLVRGAGLAPAEAARRARAEFGSPALYRDRARQARGLRPFDELRVSALDLKLGARMLVKYPGLSLVGGLAFAFAIAVGAASFEGVRQLLYPSLPLRDGDRVVGVRVWDAAANVEENRVLRDFAEWREALRSVQSLGAFRTVDRNLITGEGVGEPVEVAEISASAFRVTRVAPLLGRALVDADERAGAPPVVVVGYDVWRRRLGGRLDVVGQTVRLGATPSVVVGVMPEGYAFPVSHALWVPLQADARAEAWRRGPEVHVFGRLAPGATLASAQAELATLGRRVAADQPGTHAHLVPQVLPYARAVLSLPDLGAVGLVAINVFLLMLLVLVCGIVALLMFARAASREGEIVVRTALGATRGRIVAQLFAEALVLGGVAMAAGLAAAALALRWWTRVSAFEAGGRLPFWIDGRLSPATVLYAGALTLAGAAIAGVLPALKVTGGLGARLRQAAAGAGGLRLGGVWTAVIVAQVAVTVAFPATALFAGRYVSRMQSLDVGFPAHEYLAARLEPGGDPATDAGGGGAAAEPGDTSLAVPRARFRVTVIELTRRLSAEPAVRGVTFANRLPHTPHPPRAIEVEGGASIVDSAGTLLVSDATVDPDYFDVLDAPVLAGRGFRTGDLEPDARAVVVNRSFVRQVLGGRNPIGRRVRYRRAAPSAASPDPAAATAANPWYEIVGVVPDLGTIADDPDWGPGLYHPAAAGTFLPANVVVHVRGEPASFAPRLRALATATDPTLRLYDPLPLDAVGATSWTELAFLFKLLVLVSAIALLLSLAAIYSVMSFTVSRRTREIGVRIALGASARRVVAAVFARPLSHVALGVLAGAALTAAIVFLVYGGSLAAGQLALVVAYAALMMGVCLLACVVPTRRALRVEPTEALRADG